MSNELIAILGVGAALAGIMLSQVRNLRTDLAQRFDDKIDALGKRFDEQVIEIREVKKNVHGLGERMAHLEGLVEGLKEAIVARIAA